MSETMTLLECGLVRAYLHIRLPCVRRQAPIASAKPLSGLSLRAARRQTRRAVPRGRKTGRRIRRPP